MKNLLGKPFAFILTVSASLSLMGACSDQAGERRSGSTFTSQVLGGDNSGAAMGNSQGQGAVTETSASAGKGATPTPSPSASPSSSPTATPTPVPTPSESPSQTPNQNNGKGDGKGSDDQEVCRWFDPKEIDFAEEIPGAPAGLNIPINRYRSNGRFESGNFFFEFKVYHNGEENNEIGPKTSLDTFRSAKVATFVAIIMDANSSDCYALASLKQASRRDHSGCFAMSTNIRMADGKDRPIALLKKGDRVLNPITGKAVPIIRVIEGPEAKPMLEIGYKNAKVSVTEKHPFLTKNGLKAAKDLKKGEQVLGVDGKFHPVTTFNVLPIDPAQVVRNITLGDMSTDPIAHMVLADGVVTGDLYLQMSLEKSIMSTASKAK
jgi:hypothetical protein